MMRDELKAFIEENLLITSDGPISDEDELLLDGIIDSLGVTRLIAFIESELHIAVPVQDATIDLGGESIEALRIAALANSQGIRFTTKELFEFPTVAALSKVATTTAELGAAVTPESISFAETAHQAGLSEADLEEVLAEFGDDSSD